jgi:hypothetical protein
MLISASLRRGNSFDYGGILWRRGVREEHVAGFDSSGELAWTAENYCSIGEQHGFSTGLGSINSTRVKLGSYRLNCHLPSRPIWGFSLAS